MKPAKNADYFLIKTLVMNEQPLIVEGRGNDILCHNTEYWLQDSKCFVYRQGVYSKQACKNSVANSNYILCCTGDHELAFGELHFTFSQFTYSAKGHDSCVRIANNGAGCNKKQAFCSR